jgi:hypothetical protein
MHQMDYRVTPLRGGPVMTKKESAEPHEPSDCDPGNLQK